MPSINSANVLHRSIADHRILRRPANDLEEDPGESKVFQFAENSLSEHELNRARALKMIQDAAGPPARPKVAETGTQLLLSLVANSPHDTDLYAALGDGLQIQNKLKEATRWRLRVLELNPRHEKTVQNLATVFHNEFQLGPAEVYLKRFIDLNPWHGSYHGRLAGTLMYRGNLAGAIAEAERALELNPTLSELHGFLADAYTKINDPKSSAKHHKLLMRMRNAETQGE